MTIALRYAARSDVGLLREGNEDSAYASARLLAVADGMGGHAHGEVASSVAIAAMSSLDTDAHGGDLLSAIEAAVRNANRQLHEMVARDPGLRGMGTTLTAMLWNGRRLALVHVGDSRAYLLRNGELYQITHDHTLVQSLVDDGRITQEEAATHPQRSILLRALDGSGEVEPDLQEREAQVNDRYLLCSDGLSSVVSAETLHHTLSTVRDPEEAVRKLIDLANKGGGPDNITCIVADVIEVEDGQTVAGSEASVTVGAAGANRLGQPQPPEPPGGFTAPQPAITEDYESEPPGEPFAEAAARPVRRRRLWPAMVGLLVFVVAGLGVGGYFAWRWTQDQYFIGAAADRIVIYRGVNTELGPIQLFTIAHSTNDSVSALREPARSRVQNRIITVGSVDEGLSKIRELQDTAGASPATEPTSSPDSAEADPADQTDRSERSEQAGTDSTGSSE